MHALMTMLLTATKLRAVLSREDATAEELRAAIKSAADELTADVEHAAPFWGALADAVKKLERGR